MMHTLTPALAAAAHPGLSDRYLAAKADGYAIYDDNRAAGREVPSDRDAFARAFAQIETCLPARDVCIGVRPRKLADVHSAIVVRRSAVA